MRSTLATAALLLAPFIADAQGVRLPFGPGSRREPTELPKHAPGLSPVRQVDFRYSRLSFEAYPMINFMQTPGYVGVGATSYTTLAAGVRLDYRVAPSLSLTADATQSVLGGPFAMTTYDLGGRLKPWTSGRIKPYADVRWSYARTGGYGSYEAGVFTLPTTAAIDGRGTGSVFGVGVETPLTRRFSLNTGLAATRYDMLARQYSGRFNTWHYKVDVVRWVIAGRFNPGRWMK